MQKSKGKVDKAGQLFQDPLSLQWQLAAQCVLTSFPCLDFRLEPLILSQWQGMKVPAYRGFLGASATMHHRTQQSPCLPQQMASQLDASHCPAQPPGGLQARHQ